jgi:Leucine-rich repeat (LRR) protein
MKNEIVRLNTNALSLFSKTLSLANQLQAEQEHRPAEWFDTPEKRIRWWLDLEPQWRKAFNEAVFFHKNMDDVDTYNPTDGELQYLFNIKNLDICGNGDGFTSRNNGADISFGLTNLTGVANLTNLKRIECDYNGAIESLEPLRHLTNLETLWCDNNKISDLSPLMVLSKLRCLCCWNNQIRNIEPLASLINLCDLTLGLYDEGNPIEDFSPLTSIIQLRHLYISGCGVESLAFLSACQNLSYVLASYNNLDEEDANNILEGVRVQL